jgi:hypothetical protein
MKQKKAILIYSSCNWVRFFRPIDKDSNKLSSRSLRNIHAERNVSKCLSTIFLGRILLGMSRHESFITGGLVIIGVVEQKVRSCFEMIIDRYVT